VKLLRIWLLVVLAVLLPLRAAMAVALPCALAGVGTPSGTTHHDAAGHGHGHGLGHAVAAHEHVQHHPGTVALHDHEKACQDKCNLCSASCSATPLIATFAGVPELRDRASVSFPDLSVPAPSFLSDGQERPPRSI
jgi:hypothetical protein